MRGVKMKKKIVFVLLAIVVIAAGILSWLYLFKEKEEYHKKYSDVRIVSKSKEKDKYKYDVTYPVIKEKEFDKAMKEYVNNEIEKFESDVKKLDDKKEKELSALHIKFEIEHLAKQTMTVKFEKSVFTGGGKPKDTVKTFTYDKKEEKFLTLKDLFKKDEDYLKLVSEKSYNDLQQDGEIAQDDALLKEGTAPKKENFKEFILKNEDLILVFNRSQVAATALGVQQVIIPLQDVKDNLKKEYQVSNKDMKSAVKEEKTKEVAGKREQKLNNIDIHKKVVALTYDDGPHASVTPKLLETLKKYDAKATFFMLGQNVVANPSIVKEVHEAGHEIANHSWNHPQLTRLSQGEVKKQIEDTQNAIAKLIGEKPHHLRPPYGAFNQNVKDVAKGMNIELWDVDTLDWKTRNKDSVVSEILKHTKDGSVVLMHDIYMTSEQATEEAMKTLKAQGYQFITVSELKEVEKQRLAEKQKGTNAGTQQPTTKTTETGKTNS